MQAKLRSLIALFQLPNPAKTQLMQLRIRTLEPAASYAGPAVITGFVITSYFSLEQVVDLLHCLQDWVKIKSINIRKLLSTMPSPQKALDMPFFFLVELQMIYNAVLVSAVQYSDSVIHIYTHIHIYIYIVFHVLFHYDLLQDIWASLAAQTLKNLPTVQETQV